MTVSDPSFATNGFFEGVPDSLLPTLLEHVKIIRCSRDAIIFQENEPAECMYLIGQGTVRLSKKARGAEQETLVHLGPGEFFGEMALYDPAPRSAQATAAE